MKKIFFTFLLVFVSLSVLKSQVNLKNGLVAYFTLDGHAVDSGSNGLNGTIVGATPTTSRFNRPSTAMEFNGTNQHISIPHDASLNLFGNRTFSVWYYTDATGLKNYPNVFYKQGDLIPGSYPHFALQLAEEAGYLSNRYKTAFFGGKNTTNYTVFTKQKYTDYQNQWVHIAVTYNAIDGYLRVFFNGAISDSTYVPSFTTNTSLDSMQIGRGSKVNYPDSYFKGRIDDLRIYNRTLSKEEVLSLYNEHYFIYNRVSKTICQGDSVLAQGKYQAVGGEYYDTISVGSKVDSVVITQLIVNPTYLIPQTVTICEGGKILLGGSLRTAAGVYYDSLQTTKGCDSVIKTTLVVYPSYFGNQTITICQGDSALIAGNYYSSYTVVSQTFNSVNGCDSTVVTTLVVNPSQITTNTVFLCSGDSVLIDGNYIKTAGVYADSLSGALSCDSIVLTTVVVNTISNAVSQNTYVLVAQEGGAVYQWLDCNNNNTPIFGENQQSFIATVNGNYAVAIAKNGCADTSACYVVNTLSVDESLREKVNIFPNPAKDWFTVDLGETHNQIQVSVVSITGKKVAVYTESNVSQIKIPAQQLPAGMYLLEIAADGKNSVSKIIVE